MDTRIYGIWNGTGWMQRAYGEIVHSPYPQVLEAEKANCEIDNWQIREIGYDGRPVEPQRERLPNPPPIETIGPNPATSGGLIEKAVRPQLDKAIHRPDANK